MELILLFVLGVLIGSLFTAIYLNYRKKAIGTIRIDTSDPSEPPYLFLELDEPIDAFYDKKEVICKINTQSYISQK